MFDVYDLLLHMFVYIIFPYIYTHMYIYVFIYTLYLVVIFTPSCCHIHTHTHVVLYHIVQVQPGQTRGGRFHSIIRKLNTFFE